MNTKWKGYLKFGLVPLPVRMYTAVSPKKGIAFNLPTQGLRPKD